MRRPKMSLVFAVLAILLCIAQAHAVAIGVNRASIEFEDVLRDGYAEALVTITTDTPVTTGGEVMFDSEIATWLNQSTVHYFNFSSTSPYVLHVILEPPADTQIQTYQLNMSVLTGELMRTTKGKIGTSTRASFRIPITIHMTGTEHVLCSVGGLVVRDTERGQPLEIKINILNRGNVQINPDIIVEVFDKTRSQNVDNRSVDFGSRILPTVANDATRTLPFDLPPSQYWASVKVPLCNYAGLMSFDVLEPGEIKDDGDFIRIDAPSWANTGDIIPIKAIFRNKGVRGVRASFKGTISRVDTQEIVKVIDSQEYIVDPDATAAIETFFNPQEGGQYRVLGKIYYNNKLTIERDAIINVNGAPIKSPLTLNTMLVIIVIVIVILILLILIRRRKRQARR